MVTKQAKAEIHHQLFDLLFLVKLRMKEIVKDSDENLSPLQLLILRIVFRNGDILQSQLVSELGRDKSQVTRLVQDLVQRGLIFRNKNETDGRHFVLSVEPSASKKIALFTKHEQKVVYEMLAGISREHVEILINSLKIMRSNLGSS
ncbi:MAG: MarR family transcriptional regulator [Gammaproteobacteria bacterium]|nr:MarR family transcriptional regulator [Gammaproteobacteria bacterium]